MAIPVIRALRFVRAPTTPLWARGAPPFGGSRPSDSFLSKSEGMDRAEWGVHTLHGCVRFYLRDTGMAGLASAWAMARRRLKEYRRKVDAATRCSGVCPYI